MVHRAGQGPVRAHQEMRARGNLVEWLPLVALSLRYLGGGIGDAGSRALSAPRSVGRNLSGTRHWTKVGGSSRSPKPEPKASRSALRLNVASTIAPPSPASASAARRPSCS